MTVIEQTAEIPFSTKQMYDLVNDLEQYPQFLPWCTKAEVLTQHFLQEAPEIEEKTATLYFSKQIFSKSFTTINRLYPHERIEIRLLEGPFSHLEGEWRFESIGTQNTRIHLYLRFNFKHPVLSFTLGPLFEKIAHSLVNAFTHRAYQVYALAT